MLAGGDNVNIILRQIKFFLVTEHLGLPEFRLPFSDFLQVLLCQRNGYQIRIREITIILGVLLAPHGIGFSLIVIPSSGLLNDLFAAFDQIDLTLGLPFNGPCNGLKGV